MILLEGSSNLEESFFIGDSMYIFFKTIFSFILESVTGLSPDGLIYEKILDLAFKRIYEVLNAIAYGLSGIILMITGFLVAYFNVLSQYDRVGSITMGAVASGGIVLIFIGFGIVYNNTKKDFTSPAIRTPQANLTPHTSPIELAVAALVQEFIKEREFSREKEREQMKIQSTQVEKSLTDEYHIH